MDNDNIIVLLSEIDRQLQTSRSEMALEDRIPRSDRLFLTPADECDAFQRELTQLRGLIEQALCEDMGSLICPAEVQNCIWKLPAFCQQSPTFIRPNLLREHCLAMQKNRREEASFNDDTTDIWHDPALRSWAETDSSTMLLIQGTSKATDRIERFSCEITSQLEESFPTLYMLNSTVTRRYFKQHGPLEFLRQLTIQGLRQIMSARSIQFLAIMIKRFQKAVTTVDWFLILEALMQAMPIGFLVIDASALASRSRPVTTWIKEFNGIFLRLEKNTGTTLKVLILSNEKVVMDFDGIPSQRLKLTSVSNSSRRRGEFIPPFSSHVALPFYEPVSSKNKSPESNKGVRDVDEVLYGQDSAPRLIIGSKTNFTTLNSNEASAATIPSNHQTPYFLNSLEIPAAPAAHTFRGSLQARFETPYTVMNRQGEIDIAILCALPLEADAIETLCDGFLDLNDFRKSEGDANMYSVALIGQHKVVIVHLPAMGQTVAATAATQCLASFPKVRLILLAGVCGGVPLPPKKEILLGDVIISDGIVLYDFGKQYPSGFQRKNTTQDNARKPPPVLNALLSKLKTRRGSSHLLANTAHNLDLLRRDPLHGEWAHYPGIVSDVLYESTYLHKHHNFNVCLECTAGAINDSTCESSQKLHCTLLGCDPQRTIHRKRHQEIVQLLENGQNAYPAIHFGNLGSGDKVMKSGADRDRIATLENVIGFEMEGAGIWDSFPCIIIKGVCDYADSHKTKDWQNYAATTAAACVKALLDEWPVRH